MLSSSYNVLGSEKNAGGAEEQSYNVLGSEKTVGRGSRERVQENEGNLLLEPAASSHCDFPLLRLPSQS